MENETVNKDVKTLLAKLLATEDISVIHKNMPSAYFDTKNRELGLPILKNMSGDIYDLMTLHEVGHALWTDNEKWMKIVKKDNDDDLPKSFINVTEDVRIERKIKDKYPGGRRAFVSGYEKLFKDDFFGTAGKDIEEINLADKINLHSKVGDFTGVEFSDEEMLIYNLCKESVTFEDAIKAAKALYKYCKDNAPDEDWDDLEDFGHGFMGADSEEYDDMESEESEESESDMDSPSPEGEEFENSSEENSENSPADKFKDEVEKAMDEMKAENEEKSEENSDGKSESTEGKSEEAEETKENKREGGFGMGEVTNPMQASTVVEWEERKRDLNTDDGKEYWYASIPESKMTNIIDYKVMIKHCEDYYNSVDSSKDKFIEGAYKYLNAFEKESMKSVNYMLKEFEMKKSADAYVRSTTAKTGTLDMIKIHSYKYNDDLFKKVTIMPGEKNHGLVMLLDWSGSMNGTIHDAYKQLMQLVWFCRRAGIKFEVFAFTDNSSDLGMNYNGHEYYNNPYWKFKLGDMAMSDHHLLNLFSDRMSKSETKKMAHYLTVITVQMHGYNYYGNGKRKHLLEDYIDYDREYENIHWFVPGVPSGMHLGGTPLNAAIVNLMSFIPKYRKGKGIQNLSVAIITDGASNSDGGKLVERIHTDHNTGEPKNSYWSTESSPRASKAVRFITDPVTKKNHKVVGRDSASYTATYLKMLKDRTGCNVVGFYIAASTTTGAIRRNDLYWLFPNKNLDEVKKEIRKNKMAIADSFGYDEYYVIPSGKLDTATDELEVDSSMTKGRMAKAFVKHMKSKVVNRMLLNKFVEKVA